VPIAALNDWDAVGDRGTARLRGGATKDPVKDPAGDCGH